MASREAAVVDLDSDDAALSTDQLVFQDIPHSHSVSAELSGENKNTKKKKSSAGAYEQTHTFTNFPNADDSQDEDDKAELLSSGSKDQTAAAASSSFWSFEYYQSFFNVDTYQVLSRVAGSMYPNPRNNYLQTTIRPNPDLYGPFWICTTLVFSIAVAGNIAKYFTTATSQEYQYDFHKVTFAATTIFTYWWLIPTMLYALLWWRGNKANYTMTELLCIYGYSLFTYIPISILWVIPVVWLRWLLMMIGVTLSGGVLVLNLWAAVKNDKKKIAISTMVAVMLLHGLLAVGFLLYFFDSPTTDTTSTIAPIIPVVANSTTTMKPGKHH